MSIYRKKSINNNNFQNLYISYLKYIIGPIENTPKVDCIDDEECYLERKDLNKTKRSLK